MIGPRHDSPHRLFDRQYYRRQLRGLSRKIPFLYAHYSSIGWRKGKDPHPLFDTAWYLSQYPDVAAAGIEPAAHYVREGYREGRQPHPLFDPGFYIETNKDVAASGENPLLHFIRRGAGEGRSPHPLFDTAFYATHLDGRASRSPDELLHDLSRGAPAGRASPLFDDEWYSSTYPDVKTSGMSPLLHFIRIGSGEGRNPNPLFDTKWYRSSYPDLAGSEQEPLSHYLRYGAAEGRDPHPSFSTTLYLRDNPDVAASGQNPLAHYLAVGAAQGRTRRDSLSARHMAALYASAGETAAATLSAMSDTDASFAGRHFGYRPLNVFVDPRREDDRSIWILLPGISRAHATGGPNTAYILGCLLAKRGFSVNFVSSDAAADQDLGPIKRHLRDLSGIDVEAHRIGFYDASNRHRCLSMGVHDVLIATAWWTAQPAKAAAGLLRSKRFYYLIQDYEVLFYGASVKAAMAEETYDFDHVPIINTNLLKDHLAMMRVGRYADPQFVANAIVFEPAVDTSRFYREPRSPGGPKRLLFYARPTLAERNLFGLGVLALRSAVEAGLFGDEGWDFIGMGEDFEPIALGRSYVLEPAPWLTFELYGRQMREADILLSLMMSPHPSYPPLEMAACSGLTVTTTFGSKTAERLRRISPRIIGVRPTLDELTSGLARAVARLGDRDDARPAESFQPKTWVESLDAVLPAIVEQLGRDGLTPRGTSPSRD